MGAYIVCVCVRVCVCACVCECVCVCVSGECLHVYSCTTVHLKWVHVLLYTHSIVLLCVVHVLAWYRHMYEEDTLTRLWVDDEVFRDEGGREPPLSDRRLSPPPVLITAVRGGRRGQRSGGHSYINCID